MSDELKNAINDIQNEVYKATSLYERLEGENKIIGNGHHMRQEVARFAGELLKERWEKMETMHGHHRKP